MVVRILIWSLAEAKTSLDELRDTLAPLPSPSTWIWNDVSDRFGALVVDEDDVAGPLADARALIGREPDVFEEFDGSP